MRERAGAAIWLLAAALLWGARPAAAQLEWSSKDEKSKFRVGLLGQVQAESADVAGSDETADNLFVRRLRVLMGFTFGDKISVSLATESPNLGKANAQGVKESPDILIHDLVFNYKASQAFQLEAGVIVPPLSYNHMQSAATLLATDYGPYSFVESGPITARFGRDYGLQARGYLAGDRLEYRAGLFQGARGANAANEFRYVGRLMYQFFTPQTGYFYRGTSFGKARTVAIGASYDRQEEYSFATVDTFFDLPLGANALSGQIDWQTVDGDSFLAALPEQEGLLVEAGFYIGAAKLMPFAQYAAQDFAAAARVDEERLTLGLGYIVSGHGNTLKLSYTRIEPEVGEARDQINLQWQIYQF